MAISTVSRAIKGKPNHLLIDSVLCHAARNMRVMMLHADQLLVTSLKRPLRRQILRMKIIRNRLGRDFENPREMLDRLIEEPERLHVLEIADVLTEKRCLP